MNISKYYIFWNRDILEIKPLLPVPYCVNIHNEHDGYRVFALGIGFLKWGICLGLEWNNKKN